MKFLISLLLVTQIFAQENAKTKDWILDRINIYTENDKYFGTDHGYSNGAQITALYFIPEENYDVFDLLGYEDQRTYSYITLSLTNKIFNPTDTLATDLILDDRPYAGWTYADATIHKTTKNNLRSLSLKVGAIGPASGSRQIQNEFHKIINVEINYGWDNQLNNELGINLKYTQKWRYFTNITGSFEGSIVPFTSAELGNVSVKANAGMMARVGWNIPRDYGVSSIDVGADPGIPVYGEYTNMKARPLSLSFNLTAGGSAVARDIFLDGNTFSNSHSVNIRHLVAYYGLGFTLRYKNLVVDSMIVETTKQFNLQKNTHGIGTLIVSWLF